MDRNFEELELSPELLEAVSGGTVDDSQEQTILNILRRTKAIGTPKESIVRYIIMACAISGGVLEGVTAEEIQSIADTYWDSL